ncbi:MAG: arylformamidase [Rhodothermales bacterium]|jgi:arylformamidase
MPLTLVIFYVDNRPWLADLTRPVNLARPVSLDGSGSSWFGAPPPRGAPLRMPGFVGRVAEGGSVNVAVLSLAPHCAGTHTESSAHITERANPINAVATPGLIPASLVTMAGGSAAELRDRLDEAQSGFLEGLIIRQPSPGPFEPEALSLAVTRGVRHLLVEAPSVDPESDGGRLDAHRAFWGLPAGHPEGTSARTITELVRVPADARDGAFLLDLQLPSLTTDAVPSRPVLYPVLPTE